MSTWRVGYGSGRKSWLSASLTSMRIEYWLCDTSGDRPGGGGRPRLARLRRDTSRVPGFHVSPSKESAVTMRSGCTSAWLVL